MRDILGHASAPHKARRPSALWLHRHGADFSIVGAAINKKPPIAQQSRLPVRLEQWRCW